MSGVVNVGVGNVAQSMGTFFFFEFSYFHTLDGRHVQLCSLMNFRTDSEMKKKEKMNLQSRALRFKKKEMKRNYNGQTTIKNEM